MDNYDANSMDETSSIEDKNGYGQTNTDMMFKLLANPDKLLETNQENITSYPMDNQHIYTSEQYTYNTYDNKNNSYNTMNDYISEYQPTTKKDSEEDIIRQKKEIMMHLGEYQLLGEQISRDYSLDDSLESMQNEYYFIKNKRAKLQWVSWSAEMGLLCFNGLEMFSDKHKKLPIKLKGFTNAMEAKQSDLCEILGELFEKYFAVKEGGTGGKLASPEVRFIFLIFSTIISTHVGNMIGDSLPDVLDKLQQNPELLQKFRNQAQADKMKNMNKDQQDEYINFHEDMKKKEIQKTQQINEMYDRQEDFIKTNEVLQRHQEQNNKPRIIPPSLLTQNLMPQQTRPNNEEKEIQNLNFLKQKMDRGNDSLDGYLISRDSDTESSTESNDSDIISETIDSIASSQRKLKFKKSSGKKAPSIKLDF